MRYNIDMEKYLKTMDKTSNLFTDLQNEEKINLKENALGNNKYKIKKNFFRDLFKKNGIEKNQLLSPFLFNLHKHAAQQSSLCVLQKYSSFKG